MKYRLEALLKLKARQRKQAEIVLARAIAFLMASKKKLEELKEEKKELKRQQKEARHKMNEEMIGGGTIGNGCFHVNYLRKLKEDEEAKQEEIEMQEGVVEEAKEKVAKARKDYIEAVKQHQMMEKHKDLWAKKMQTILSKKEEKEMDELGQTIHSLKRWRGEKSLFEI
ncbi:MAG: hypothetical protein A2W61_01690 [Deltaproteobacteria bacterium RIFCSPLOWO2_01_44_7]|nr:MAG: hypothetical protein A2712_10785 [Deltaproteobacteria bacterium RIFCSPHIGHO2_01_FULL_43_49]OGQ16539.1 MAG: hypothetical protein A3D22_06485 [Deltaproteobacteria bacterium RIFCSPHIGHO2_02_FULL_44_53]OGQ28356.1 MAG: hypothetical protein A3D98_06190 [Deltaproteobacteria bacterium RIFCSPHIGHO2_12_FULL_44_21]OGQ32427.1 MAG: hypothetical protein A2979_10750 [Deltaproteobacteria bacterium RIFCSPLOWO2_01_FULL_45_74]OGQ41552.1 MAG: hypothetical protein A3I70_05095 [Deltaproteobacteria bacterium 